MEQGEKTGLLSVGTNLLLVVIKYGLAVLAGSVALLADAIHSFSDVISSATVLVGIRISRRKTRSFPYGLYKVENLVSLLSAFFIFFAGYEIVHSALFTEQSLRSEYLPYAMGGVLLTMAITFFFSRYELREGKKLGSPSLIADAQHIRTDLFSSGVILCGLLGSFFNLPLDKAAALVVVILVFKAGIGIFLDAVRVLLDASLDFESMDSVKTAILESPQVTAIHSLRGRNSGRFKFIEADIGVRVKELEKAHQVTKQIETAIKERVSNVDRVLIHCEPEKREIRVGAVPLQGNRNSVSEHFGEAPFFLVFSIRERDRLIVEERILANPYMDEERGKGLKVSKWLLRQDVDTLYTLKTLEGRGPGYVLSSADADIVVTQATTLQELREEIRKNHS